MKTENGGRYFSRRQNHNFCFSIFYHPQKKLISENYISRKFKGNEWRQWKIVFCIFENLFPWGNTTFIKSNGSPTNPFFYFISTNERCALSLGLNRGESETDNKNFMLCMQNLFNYFFPPSHEDNKAFLSSAVCNAESMLLKFMD